jgi:hypothetical protein
MSDIRVPDRYCYFSTTLMAMGMSNAKDKKQK